MAKQNTNKFYLNDPNLPTATTEFEYTPEMIKELTKCKKDILYFAENYFTIVNLDRGKEKIKLYGAQKRVLKSMVKNNRVVLLSSRQAGKTTLITIFALHYCLFNNDKSVLVVANTEKTAIGILSRIRTAYELLPNYLKAGVKDYAKTDISFVNGSRIYVSTTATTAGRSGSINCTTGDNIVTVKDKKTGTILSMRIDELAKILENDGIIINANLVDDNDGIDSSMITHLTK